jgi:putative endonuclease
MFWVYILRSADGSYYTAHTNNLESRIGQYQKKECAAGYADTHHQLELVWWQACATQEEALLAERQIKNWNDTKKESMMRGDLLEMA